MTIDDDQPESGAFRRLLDSIFNRLAEREIADRLTSTLGPDMISRIIGRLHEQGFSYKVDTWAGVGEPDHLTPDEVRAALGSAITFELTSTHLLNAGEVAKLLADHLPATVHARAHP